LVLQQVAHLLVSHLFQSIKQVAYMKALQYYMTGPSVHLARTQHGTTSRPVYQERVVMVRSGCKAIQTHWRNPQGQIRVQYWQFFCIYH
jgi:hypothetical protein